MDEEAAALTAVAALLLLSLFVLLFLLQPYHPLLEDPLAFVPVEDVVGSLGRVCKKCVL